VTNETYADEQTTHNEYASTDERVEAIILCARFRRLGAPEDLEWERVLVTVARRRVCGQICRLGSRILAGLAIEVRWAAALLVVRA
jgi:hypothetical protein